MKLVKCELCKTRPAEHRHHVYSNTRWARKTYGTLLDDRKNILNLCSICHLNKSVPHMDENEFCEIMGIEPQSKTAKFKATLDEMSA